VSAPSDIFDKSAALDRVAGDQALLMELLKIAQGDIASTLPALGEAVGQGRIAEVQRVAHRLRSALGNLGALKVYEVLTELERAAARGQLEDCKRLIPSMETLIQEFFSVSKGD
jgi:HPt (histidine-containing phosphotransfer) domain-containing protein